MDEVHIWTIRARHSGLDPESRSRLKAGMTLEEVIFSPDTSGLKAGMTAARVCARIMDSCLG